MPEDYTAGQPGKSTIKKRTVEKNFYELGRASGALDQKKKENEQEAAITLVQRLMLQEKEIQMKDMIAELQRIQKDILLGQAAASMPPPLPEMPPNMLPEPPMGMMGGGPPMQMGGPPPGIIPGDQGMPMGPMGPMEVNAAPPMF